MRDLDDRFSRQRQRPVFPILLQSIITIIFYTCDEPCDTGTTLRWLEPRNIPPTEILFGTILRNFDSSGHICLFHPLVWWALKVIVWKHSIVLFDWRWSSGFNVRHPNNFKGSSHISVGHLGSRRQPTNGDHFVALPHYKFQTHSCRPPVFSCSWHQQLRGLSPHDALVLGM